jgi:hypothetical protein
VAAWLSGDEIRIGAQPIAGNGDLVRRQYPKLAAVNPQAPTEVTLRELLEAVSATFVRWSILRFSAWSKLVPVLFALFSLLRPRRYVELGVHNGMSFFAACQIAEHLNAKTQCVAVDSWVGDPHASFHPAEVFDQFRATLKDSYPLQHYIQGMFLDARTCFDDGSIDLLHIDGYHTYEAVKEDFETWLPKMSEAGVVIFHDVNVHERGFGVWRFWGELTQKYPAFRFFHGHGLGIVYVGDTANPLVQVFRLLNQSPEYTALAQQYFEMMGELALDYRTLLEDVKGSELTDTRQRLQATLSAHQAVLTSISWRMTGPLRKLVSNLPQPVRVAARRGLKLAYWGITPWRTAERLRFLKQQRAKR